jgi:hypothetical protein
MFYISYPFVTFTDSPSHIRCITFFRMNICNKNYIIKSCLLSYSP